VQHEEKYDVSFPRNTTLTLQETHWYKEPIRLLTYIKELQQKINYFTYILIQADNNDGVVFCSTPP